MSLTLKPLTQRAAKAWISANHRHLTRPQAGDIFRDGLTRGDELVGVVSVGRPRARMLQDGFTAEVLRLCTLGDRNACSMLYGAAVRAARALGYRRLYTYTLPDEPGSSLRASGWRDDGETDGGEWTRPSRARREVEQASPKRRWRIDL